MPSKLKKSQAPTWVPTSPQQRVVIVLLAVNVIVCMLNMLCLRSLGPGRREISSKPSELDIEDLYSDPGLPAARSASPSEPWDLPSGGAEQAQPGAAVAVAAPVVAPQPSPLIAPAPATAPGPAVCGTCSGRAHGLLPTTRRKSAACDWDQRDGMTLADAPEETENPYDLAVAQEFCAELGSGCSGVTCSRSAGGGAGGGSKCFLKQGSPDSQLFESQADVTYVKRCPPPGSAESADCGEEGAAPPPPGGAGQADLRGAAVVVLAHNREDYLRSCLESLLTQADAALFHFYVSLDSKEAEAGMSKVAQDVAAARGIPVDIWSVAPRTAVDGDYNKDQLAWFEYNSAKIAHHYWVALERAFMEHNFEHAIFVEEDLIFSPDFLSLFRSTAWLFDADTSLWCVSSWNDVGFKLAFSDQCRLFRTSYFPGLGFLLPRHAWLRMREMWPPTPTMGWDYWMRTAFRQEGKECIVPEISRSHHIATKGSSVNNERQFKLFRSMALAEIPNICGLSSPCRQFGDVSYLMAQAYEQHMRDAVRSAPLISVSDLSPLASAALYRPRHECKAQKHNLGAFDTPEACASLVLGNPDCAHEFQWSKTVDWGCRCCEPYKAEGGNEHEAWSVYKAEKPDNDGRKPLDPNQLYVVPYVFEDYDRIVPLIGLRPRGTREAIPRDIRAEHYGTFVGRHLQSRAHMLLVDQRSHLGYLPASLQRGKHPDLTVMPAQTGEACSEACEAKGLRCDAEQLHFINNCPTLLEHFGCKWCAHQVGEELPVFVSDSTNMNVGQCLVTFISPLRCEPKHPSTRRLCACLP